MCAEPEAVQDRAPAVFVQRSGFGRCGREVVVRFLAQTLRAADWAKDNLHAVYDILKRETRAGDEGVTAAYRDGFHRSLHPDLSAERLELLRIQKTFMWVHGFLDADVDLEAWVDFRPLAAAQELLQHREIA